MATKVHIAHLVNPVRRPLEADVASCQPLTFESMRRAAERAASVATVELLTAQYPEDHPVIPAGFRPTPDLTRSAADLGDFTVQRKLPLLCDLVQRLHAGSSATWLVYTNVDIILHPDFYLEVVRRIERGLDAFIINRRRVPAHYRRVDELPAIFAEAGLAHPGFDCFVFHRALFPRFELAHVCVGIPYVGILFAQNLFCHARHFALFEHDRLTFHVGLEVFKKRDREYLAQNRTEFWRAVDALWPHLDNRRFPWGDRPLLYRFWRWGLHPSIPIRLALMLEPRRWRRPGARAAG